MSVWEYDHITQTPNRGSTAGRYYHILDTALKGSEQKSTCNIIIKAASGH